MPKPAFIRKGKSDLFQITCQSRLRRLHRTDRKAKSNATQRSENSLNSMPKPAFIRKGKSDLFQITCQSRLRRLHRTDRKAKSNATQRSATTYADRKTSKRIAAAGSRGRRPKKNGLNHRTAKPPFNETRCKPSFTPCPPFFIISEKLASNRPFYFQDTSLG